MKRALVFMSLMVAMAVPSPAVAAPGWELPQISSFVGGNKELPNTTYSRRCGSSPYGVWRFTVGVTQAGRQGKANFRVRLSPDGVGHKPTRVRFRGEISKRLERQTRTLLRQVSFRVAGEPKKAESVYPDGRVQATRPFNPRRRDC